MRRFKKTSLKRKIITKGKKFLKKRYSGRRGMGRLYNDVRMIKGVLNSEKKFTTANHPAGSYLNLGIHNDAGGTVSGHQLIHSSSSGNSIFPVISQGTGNGNRIGSTIRVHSAYIRLHFRPQTSYTGGGKIKIYMVEKKSDSFVIGTSPIDNILEIDPFFNAYTTLSRRSVQDYSQYRILATKSVYFPTENYTGALDEFHKDVELKLKFKNRHARYENTGNVVIHGNWGLVLVSNFGNNANNTGVRFNWSSTIYYYDN